MYLTQSRIFVLASGIVQLDGNVHRRAITDMSGKTLQGAIREVAHEQCRVMTDENPSYLGIEDDFASHETVCHSSGDIYANAIESSFAPVKRGLIGIHHAVSKKHLHCYLPTTIFSGTVQDVRWTADDCGD